MKKSVALFLPLLLFFYIFDCQNSKAQSVINFQVNSNLMSANSYIYFTVAKQDSISLKIYNRYGNVIKTHFDKTFLPIGNYAIKSNIFDIENGTYYIHFLSSSGVRYNHAISKIISTETEKITKRLEIVFYPNPTSDKVNLAIEGHKNIIISDLSGKELKRLETTETSFSMVEFNNGTYIVSVFTSNNEMEVVQKIVLQK